MNGKLVKEMASKMTPTKETLKKHQKGAFPKNQTYQKWIPTFNIYDEEKDKNKDKKG